MHRHHILSTKLHLWQSCYTSLLVLTIISAQLPGSSVSALKCYCSECGNESTCELVDNKESQCFKSVDRFVENNTYFISERFGCLSGAEGSLGPLQCHYRSSDHNDPKFITCCNNDDRCNLRLRDPTDEDDPRWSMTEVPNNRTNEESDQQSIYYIINFNQMFMVAFFACSSLAIICLTLRCRFRTRSDEKKPSQLESQDSICSFVVNPYKEDLKDSYFPNHHRHTSSSSSSTHTYSTSDCMKPPIESHNEENTLGSIENSSTLPDLTSGVGDKMLRERTMARAVDSGQKIPVGSGRFGRVFRVNFHCEDLAVKAFREIDSDSWRREESILKRLSHENIVRFIASETHNLEFNLTETWMFLEYCPYGSLCDFLDNYEVCGPQQAVKILYSVIKGLHYLHENYAQGYKPSIAHRDIKSKNILMKTPEVCCLADFGHAVVKVAEDKLDFGGYERIQVGTIRYMAPEILKPPPNLDASQFHTFAQADLYQFGLVIWEVCQRTALDVLHPAGLHKLPYDGVVPQNPDLQHMIKIVCEDNHRPPFALQWDKHPLMQQLSTLMVECWRANPKARMESLGVKKRFKEMYDTISPHQVLFYQNNLIENYNLAPSFYGDKDKTRSNDFTL